MNGGLESNLLRALAILGLAVALAVAVYITVNSGVLSADEETVSSETTETATTEETATQEPAAGTTTDGTPASQNTYEVKPGDSFASIAVEYDTSIARIVELNPNVNPQNLKPGTALIVP